MKQNPCSICKNFKQFDTGAVSCYGVRSPEFYWPENIHEMLAHCPLGWRAKKSGKNDFDIASFVDGYSDAITDEISDELGGGAAAQKAPDNK